MGATACNEDDDSAFICPSQHFQIHSQCKKLSSIWRRVDLWYTQCHLIQTYMLAHKHLVRVGLAQAPLIICQLYRVIPLCISTFESIPLDFNFVVCFY